MSLVGILLLFFRPVSEPQEFFKIHVVDSMTGRGVPLVELDTVNKLRYFTDSNGIVAFNEPGLMGRSVFFSVSSPGYEFPKDGLGYRGVALQTKPGGSATISLNRVAIAERVCRLTGQGIYRDSAFVGEPAPISNATLNGGVMGQDTAQAEIFKGRMLWFWGDTDRPDYPLGNFHTSGAYATFPKGHRGADAGIEFHYFTGPNEFVRAMISSKDTHPIWISGLVVLGAGDNEQLFAYYTQMRSLNDMEASGLLRWNEKTEQFDVMKTFGGSTGWRHLDSHTFRMSSEGAENVLGNFPPTVRVPADETHLLDPSAYEAFSCLDPDGKPQRSADGSIVYSWQRDAPPITPKVEQDLIAKGQIKAAEAHFLPTDSEGTSIFPHNGSVHWNAHRKKWIAIFTRLGGKDSELGDIYYSEATAPTGPFRHAVSVVDHRKYTFYNPVHHPFLDESGGRYIYFEGTYTAEFSGNDNPTPLYNYNQILYRLDLDDPRLDFAKE